MARWACCLLLFLPWKGWGQESLDSLYCRLQARLEKGVELSNAKESIQARDTLVHALDQFPAQRDVAFQRLLGEYHYWIGYSAFYISNAEPSEYDNALGIQSLNIADSLISGTDKAGSALKARILRTLGQFTYFMEENVFDAQNLYESAYREWLLAPQKDSVEVAVVVQCMGQAAGKLGEYEKAIDLYRQSLDIRERLFGKIHVRVGHAYWNLGNAYYNSDKYKEAADAYQTALDIMYITAPDDINVIAKITSNLATTFELLGEYAASISKHKAAIELSRNHLGPFSKDLILSLSNLAFVLAKEKQFAEAKTELSKADKIARHHTLTAGPFLAALRICEAYVLEKEHNTLAALSAVQASMAAVSPGLDPVDWRKFPDAATTSEPMVLLKSVWFKSSLLYNSAHTDSTTIPCLQASLQGYELASRLNDRLRLEFEDRDDKLFLSHIGHSFLPNALHATSELLELTGERQYIHHAFKFIEQNKFQLLLEFLRKSRVQASAEIGEKAVLELDALRRRSTELDYLLGLPGLSLDSQRYYQSELLHLRLEQRSLQDSLEAQSRLFKTIYGKQSIIDMDSFQRLIPEHSAALSFAITDSAVFVLMVNSDTVTYRQSILPPQFADSVSRWLALCRRPVEEKQEIQEFARLGYFLYRLLLEPEVEKLHGIDGLLLIPDGVLGNLPFEALVMAAPTPETKGFARLPYLIHKFRCHYAASATLWCDQQTIRFGDRAMECLGIGWGSNSVDSLPGVRGKIKGLKGTEKELETLQNIMVGKFLLAGEATEANFKSLAPQYAVLHLALHARATEADPQILFPSGGSNQEDGILHFHELFPLHLRSRMAVLSACETGTGRLIQGEGIQSMSSGFAAAGVPSLLMSLWEVDDNAGGEIIQTFYEGIRSGMTIDASLQQAKLRYLDNAKGYKAAPFYWSTFVPMGNMAPLHLQTPTADRWWVFLAGAMVCMCIVVTYRIYIKIRKSI